MGARLTSWGWGAKSDTAGPGVHQGFGAKAGSHPTGLRPPTPRGPHPRAHCACRCGPPSRPGRCRRRSPRCPRRCPRSRRGWAGSCCSRLRRRKRREPSHLIWAGTRRPLTSLTGPGQAELEAEPGAGRGAGPGAGPRPSAPGALPPHLCCRCCPSSPGGRHSGRCPRCHSTCHRCYRCRHHTGTRLWAHRPLSRSAQSGGQTPARQGPGGHSREWQVLPFQPSSQAQ